LAQSPNSAAVVAPKFYHLAGGAINVSYISSDTGGQPFFVYQDSYRTLHLSGDQIRQAEVADLGTVVTVTLVITVDFGSTTFSVLLPRVNLPDQRGDYETGRRKGIVDSAFAAFQPGNEGEGRFGFG
jgi:hypothetical protein